MYAAFDIIRFVRVWGRLIRQIDMREIDEWGDIRFDHKGFMD